MLFPRPRSLIFASGTETGGGSGFENLVLKAREGKVLKTNIVGVVSNHKNGGVRARAEKLGIPFYYFGPPWSALGYSLLALEADAEFFLLSGWLKRVAGLDSRCTISIHPGPLMLFGGKGMYGHRVHEAVMAAYRVGEIQRSAVCMHFVTPEYDRGPCFFRCTVQIWQDDTPETLAKRVNACEHLWQPEITNRVIHREITWDGCDPASLTFPEGYKPTGQHFLGLGKY